MAKKEAGPITARFKENEIEKELTRIRSAYPRVKKDSQAAVMHLIAQGTGTLVFGKLPRSDELGQYVKLMGKIYRQGDTISVEELVEMPRWESFVEQGYFMAGDRWEANEKHKEVAAYELEVLEPLIYELKELEKVEWDAASREAAHKVEMEAAARELKEVQKKLGPIRANLREAFANAPV